MSGSVNPRMRESSVRVLGKREDFEIWAVMKFAASSYLMRLRNARETREWMVWLMGSLLESSWE